jgi:formylglycine-generating enzyme required for sulfatase activity
VGLSLSTDSGANYPNPCATVSGDVGSGVPPGTGKHIVWNAGADFPGLASASCRLRVTADDGQTEAPVGFVAIAPGTFMMGSPTDEPGRGADETLHQVTLTHGYSMQATEVTNKQYLEMVQWAYDHGYAKVTSDLLRDNLDGSSETLAFLGSGSRDISFSDGVFSCLNPDHPVAFVTWYGSVAYCDWLSLQQGLPRAYDHATWQCNAGNPLNAAGYRLPTEAEWEYACRAGSTTAFTNGPAIPTDYCYPLDPNLDQMGWYCGNAEAVHHPVAGKLPNAWGLYDMHGNAVEWCNDWYGLDSGAATDPAGPGAGSGRVVRGGGVNYSAAGCRSACRGDYVPYAAGEVEGFRAVRTAE